MLHQIVWFGLLIQCHLKVNGDYNACTCLGILDFHVCITESPGWAFLSPLFSSCMNLLADNQG